MINIFSIISMTFPIELEGPYLFCYLHWLVAVETAGDSENHIEEIADCRTGSDEC